MTFANKITGINVFHLFKSFPTSKCFDLFAVIFMLRLDNLESNSV